MPAPSGVEIHNYDNIKPAQENASLQATTHLCSEISNGPRSTIANTHSWGGREKHPERCPILDQAHITVEEKNSSRPGELAAPKVGNFAVQGDKVFETDQS